ncbi:ABC transporter substrate-binding protein [Lysinibacter sp. HNR]|uniref:ABC transporter substrate-binding protein n=1 Tax=Lysinibacter sp. HNR TaxID=3031408 RepID=UPI002434AF76|nr:ABC transporter substrate-binding protein [Lysinibacter sp. HNR]WGD38294.1 ABC transporter substrate-binding protein [Lysinibacter sp. HNR]
MKLRRLLKLIGIAAIMALIAGCTTASQQVMNDTGGSTSEDSIRPFIFDPETVPYDETLAALVPQEIRDRGTLIIGSDTSYAPAEFLGGPDGQTPMGFDVDFAHSLGSMLGLDISYETAGLATILPALGTKYDLGISAFAITQERLGAVNMVRYFTAGSIWAVQKDNPNDFDPQNLCGSTLGVQTGSVQETYILTQNDECVVAGNSAIDIVSLKNQTEVTTRLVAGGVDAIASGAATITYALLQTGGQLELIGELFNPAEVGIAVAKDNVELAELVASAMNKLIEDGFYGEVLQSWDLEILAVDEAVVNPAPTR